MISPNYVLRCLSLILMLAFVTLTANPGEKNTSDFSQNGALFLEQYCFSCHTGDEPLPNSPWTHLQIIIP